MSASRLTLWDVCKALSSDELTALHVLAKRQDRGELRVRLNKIIGSLAHSECLHLDESGSLARSEQLVDELIRMAANARQGCDEISLSTQRDVIRQLKCIVGLGTDHPAQARRWRLEVSPSSAVSGSGDGVFLHGACEAGAVLAVYPGLAYSIAELPLLAKHCLEGNHYTLFLRNGIVLDGRPDGPSRAAFDEAHHRDLAALGRSEPLIVEHGELAVGHRINHPPRSMRPNVHVEPFDLGREEDAALHPHLSVFLARPPPVESDDSPWKRTAVIIASRALQNEELWLDYKLRGAAHALPPWYTPSAESIIDQEAEEEHRRASRRGHEATTTRRPAGAAARRTTAPERRSPVPCYYY